MCSSFARRSFVQCTFVDTSVRPFACSFFRLYKCAFIGTSIRSFFPTMYLRWYVRSFARPFFIYLFPFLATQRATQFPCAPGTYSNKTGNVRWEQCEACPEGHYCPQGTSVPKECPKGTYYDVLGAKVRADQWSRITRAWRS